jgi:hypothetical protein
MEGWRALGRIQNAQPAAGSSPNVEQPPAFLYRFAHRIHRRRDTRNLRRYSAADLLIFPIDDFQNLGRGAGINVSRRRIYSLCQELVEIH